MNIPLFPERIEQVPRRIKLLTRMALFLSAPLNRVSPQTIEQVLTHLTKRLPAATEEQVLDIRAATCAVSRRCRSQDGCIRRSLAVATATCLIRRSVSWCTGYAQDPFRAHAWVELNGKPVGEPKEIYMYTKTIDVLHSSTVPSEVQPHVECSKEQNFESDKPNVSIREDESKKKSSLNIRALFALAKGHNKEFVAVFILGVISALLTLVQPNLMADIVEQSSSGFTLNANVWLLIAVLVFSTIFTALQYYLLQKIGEGVVFEARQSLIGHIFHLPIREFDSRSIGDMLSRISGDSSRLRTALIQGVVSLSSGIFVVLGAAIGMAIRDLFLFLLTLATVSLALLCTMLMSTIIQRASFKAQKELGLLSGLVERDLHAIRTIRAANATAKEEAKAKEQVARIRRFGIRLAKIQAFMTPVSNMSLQVCGLIVLGLGGYRVNRGYMSVSDLIAFALLLYTMIGPFGQIFNAFSEVGDSLGSFSRIRELLDLALEGEHDVSSKVSLGRMESIKNTAIHFNEVSFGYIKPKFGVDAVQRDETMVLRSVTLSAAKGQRIAIVGPSGAGKSTILQLIERFYELNSGEIYVDGDDYRSLSREELRALITYVEQDAPVISGTLRENLLLGNPSSTDLECHKVLKEVNLTHLLDRSAMGLDTQVGENGASLSGGERQRLAMARSLLSPAKIVLLDELTSNLDGINEAGMKKAVDKMKGVKTVIVVAHRLSTIIDSDAIYVLEHGRVVGVGTHQELLDTVPLYRELAKEQFLA